MPLADHAPIPRHRLDTRHGSDIRWFPCSRGIDRPGWYPALLRQHRHGYAADLHHDLFVGGLNRLRSRPPLGGGRALHPGPYPPDLSRYRAYEALPLVPHVYRLVPLAGPDLSGSPRPPRRCQRCFPSSPTRPGSDCAQLPLDRCDGPARRSHTSFDSSRLTAHQALTPQQSAPRPMLSQRVALIHDAQFVGREKTRRVAYPGLTS
jgi:hypothetical protein